MYRAFRLGVLGAVLLFLLLVFHIYGLGDLHHHWLCCIACFMAVPKQLSSVLAVLMSLTLSFYFVGRAESNACTHFVKGQRTKLVTDFQYYQVLSHILWHSNGMI